MESVIVKRLKLPISLPAPLAASGGPRVAAGSFTVDDEEEAPDAEEEEEASEVRPQRDAFKRKTLKSQVLEINSKRPSGMAPRSSTESVKGCAPRQRERTT